LGVAVEPLPPGRWIATADGKVAVPSHTRHWATSPLLNPLQKARVAWGFRPGAPAAPGRDLATAARGRFGTGFTERVLDALTAGLFAAPAHLLDGALLPMLVGRASGELVRPVGGMGRFTGALAQGCDLRGGCAALALNPLGDGGWEVATAGDHLQARSVIVALPAPAAADLLAPLAPGVAEGLRKIRFLDLRFCHSRHPNLPGASGGWGVLAHPSREGGLLGTTLGPGPGGTLQLRTSLGGAYPLHPSLESWPGVEVRLQTWFLGLGSALEVRETRADAALPLPEPGHSDRVRTLASALPPGLRWIGAGRFGGGIPGILGALEAGA
jgi:oxygen-dependent protoporphyrinogen oxidase